MILNGFALVPVRELIASCETGSFSIVKRYCISTFGMPARAEGMLRYGKDE